MKHHKRNRFFTLLWSFVPGAAEMYMGFMKNGISLMFLAVLSIVIPVFLGINEIFLLGLPLVWFYGFFHARNLAACEEETFREMEDQYIWEEFLGGKKIQIPNFMGMKYFSWILILLGAVMLWDNLSSILFNFLPAYDMWNAYYVLTDRVPQAAISVFLIVMGVKLTRGKKAEEQQEDSKYENAYRQNVAYGPAKEAHVSGNTENRDTAGSTVSDVTVSEQAISEAAESRQQTTDNRQDGV